jgi:helicase
MKLDLLEAFGIDQKLISLWKQKYAEELLPLQEKSVKEFNIFSGENIIVFAPTSSGKTFIGEMVAIHHCLKHKKVLYFVLMLYKTTKGYQNPTKIQNFYFSDEKLKFLGF